MSDKPTDREPYVFDEPRCCDTCGWWEPCPSFGCPYGWCTERGGWWLQMDTCERWDG